MKNRSKLLCLILTAMLAICVTSTTAKPKQKKIYMFGISINFIDSVTYLTDIQFLEPVYIESKTGFLYDRSIYSQQLQIWVENTKNQPNTTCTVFFSDSQAKLKKKMEKIRDKFYKDQTTILKELNVGEFKFNPIEWTEHERL